MGGHTFDKQMVMTNLPPRLKRSIEECDERWRENMAIATMMQLKEPRPQSSSSEEDAEPDDYQPWIGDQKDMSRMGRYKEEDVSAKPRASRLTWRKYGHKVLKRKSSSIGGV